MEKWFVASKKADFDTWGKKFHISPVTARIIRNRDVETELGHLSGWFKDTVVKIDDFAFIKDGSEINIVDKLQGKDDENSAVNTDPAKKITIITTEGSFASTFARRHHDGGLCLSGRHGAVLRHHVSPQVGSSSKDGTG